MRSDFMACVCVCVCLLMRMCVSMYPSFGLLSNNFFTIILPFMKSEKLFQRKQNIPSGHPDFDRCVLN